jgi:hypothetical protein
LGFAARILLVKYGLLPSPLGAVAAGADGEPAPEARVGPVDFVSRKAHRPTTRSHRNGAGKRLDKALFCAERGSFPPFVSPISTREKKAQGQPERGWQLAKG